MLLERLPEGANVLELGCGGGGPTTRRLAERFSVTGIDVAREQIIRARQAVPDATFIHADMTSLDLPAESFHAIVAFYVLTHVPRDLLPDLLSNLHRWLPPGGLLLVTLGVGDMPDITEPDWLGVPMFFSGFGGVTNRQLVEDAGFHIERAEEHDLDEGNSVVRFLWVVARR